MTYEQFRCEAFSIYDMAVEKQRSGELSSLEAWQRADDDIDALVAECKASGNYQKEWLDDAWDEWEYVNNGEE